MRVDREDDLVEALKKEITEIQRTNSSLVAYRAVKSAMVLAERLQLSLVVLRDGWKVEATKEWERLS